MFAHLTLADERWQNFVEAHPAAIIFHQPAWPQLLAECYGYKSSALAVFDSTGHVVAGLPIAEINSWLTGRRVISLPFTDFCPPLVASDEAATSLVRGIQAWLQQNKYSHAEIRWPLRDQDGVYPGESVFRHVTPLSRDPDQVFGHFKKTRVQQPIRQAQEAGITIRRGEDWHDLQLFYSLHVRTRQRLGVPVQPLRFFRLLWKALFSQSLGFVLLAYKDSQLLAGAVILHWKGTVTYKYGASDPAFSRLRPTNLLLWQAIKWGCERGYHSFDWGKTDPENEGLRSFKRGWGSEESTLRYSVVGHDSPTGMVDERKSRLLAAVIRRSPPLVCRAIGELLYGHVG